MDAILTHDLSKRFGKHTALANLNIAVPAGSIYAFVGEASCGKTTALRIFAGISTPSAGECTVLGLNPYTDAHRLHTVTGVVTETAKLYGNMTVTENLQHVAKLYELDTNDTVDRISFLLHKLDIWHARDLPAAQLPTNALQRANLARALLHRPKMLLLDEPTDGMDRETTDCVQDLLQFIVGEEGATAVLCTRHLDHAQQIGDHYAIMKNGMLMAKGNLAVLSRIYGMKARLSLELAQGSPAPKGFVPMERYWVRSIQEEGEVPDLVAAVTAAGCRLCGVRIIRPTLQDIFQHLFSDENEVTYFDGEDITYEDVQGGSGGPGSTAVPAEQFWPDKTT